MSLLIASQSGVVLIVLSITFKISAIDADLVDVPFTAITGAVPHNLNGHEVGAHEVLGRSFDRNIVCRVPPNLFFKILQMIF
jgi:hypothetical protein